MGNIQRILDLSGPAVCGIMEREVIVKNSEVARTKRLLKQKGFIIVGTGPGLTDSTTKIWFNPAGMNL